MTIVKQNVSNGQSTLGGLMSIQNSPKNIIVRWITLKGLTSLVMFLIIASLIEYFIVLYAMSLGVKDEMLLQSSFLFPGTGWNITIAVSSLFHLVPIAVIITLAASWIYLTKHMTKKRSETQKGRPIMTRSGKEHGEIWKRIIHTLAKTNIFSYIGKKTRSSRSTIRSALALLVIFLLLTLTFSLLTYPTLIYQTITNAYQENPALLNFIRSTGEVVAPIGSILSPLNDALLTAAPSLRDFVLSLGSLIKPLADLDNVGKYLVFQNAAAWMSASVALLYGEYGRKSYRYKKK